MTSPLLQSSFFKFRWDSLNCGWIIKFSIFQYCFFPSFCFLPSASSQFHHSSLVFIRWCGWWWWGFNSGGWCSDEIEIEIIENCISMICENYLNFPSFTFPSVFMLTAILILPRGFPYIPAHPISSQFCFDFRLAFCQLSRGDVCRLPKPKLAERALALRWLWWMGVW